MDSGARRTCQSKRHALLGTIQRHDFHLGRHLGHDFANTLWRSASEHRQSNRCFAVSAVASRCRLYHICRTDRHLERVPNATDPARTYGVISCLFWLRSVAIRVVSYWYTSGTMGGASSSLRTPFRCGLVRRGYDGQETGRGAQCIVIDHARSVARKSPVAHSVFDACRILQTAMQSLHARGAGSRWQKTPYFTGFFACQPDRRTPSRVAGFEPLTLCPLRGGAGIGLRGQFRAPRRQAPRPPARRKSL